MLRRASHPQPDHQPIDSYESSTAFAFGRAVLLVFLALGIGAIAGLALARFGPLYAMVLVAMPVVLAVYLRSVWVSFAAVLGVIFLLPYAVIPFSTPAGTPALIELAAFGSLVVVLAVVLCDRRMSLPASPLVVAWLGFGGFVVFAFLLGYGRGYTPQTVHDFGKFMLAFAMFVVTLILVRRRADAVLVLRLLLVGTVLAGGLAVMLYAGGPGVTERALVRLVPYGYPGGRIVRYIEDDPARPVRAVGTGVDPNSFGGLMMVGLILASGQFLSRKPVVSRWLSGSAGGLAALAVLLTYSRGAWVGAAAGIGLILLFRRRWLLPPLGLAGLAGIALGLGSGFVERLWLGFTLQDPATKLRLQEYQNALAIIRRHPWFGVGFGDAGSIDLQEGVSSTYLTIASIGGLVGLALFLLVAGWVACSALRRLIQLPESKESDLLLTLTAAFAGMLAVGLVDHYLFNIRFPHMVALFWIVAGLMVAVNRFADGSLELNHSERTG